MESLAGRSNYIQAERMMGVPDPGAFAVVFVYTLSIYYIKNTDLYNTVLNTVAIIVYHIAI